MTSGGISTAADGSGVSLPLGKEVLVLLNRHALLMSTDSCCRFPPPRLKDGKLLLPYDKMGVAQFLLKQLGIP